MKESRFIELLNLYVDQELSPSEAAQLEAEIAANPARRRTYEQYCRMQRGCSLLFEQIRANAPGYADLASAGRAADRKMLDFPTGRTVRRRALWPTLAASLAWGGGLAAAAAIAVIVLREPNSGTSSTVANAPITPDTTAVASVEPVEAAESPRRPTHYQVAAQLPRAREAEPQVVSSSAEKVNLNWIEQVQLSAVPRLSSEDLKFSHEHPTAPRATSLLHTHSAPYTPGEAFNAFEFRR